MASFYEENLGLLLQYTDLFDVIRYKHTDEDAMDYEIAKWVTDTYIQHHKILNPWPYGRKLTDYRIIVGDNGKLLIMIYDDYFNYCYSKQHPDEYYMCWGREFRELPEGAYAIWPKPHIIYNDNWKRLDSLFPCDIYKPNKKFLINGHIYYSCFY